MQLLYSRADPGPEFVSLSMLLQSDITGDGLSCHLGEPLVFPSPLSTISQPSCVQALSELHLYVNSILKGSSKSNKDNKHPTSTIRFLQEEDEKRLLSTTQIFRPQCCHGIALQYKLIKDRKQISSLIPFLLTSSVPTSTSSKSSTTTSSSSSSLLTLLEREVSGVILCVGITGIPSAFGTSSLTYTMSQKMNDCITILCKIGTLRSSPDRPGGSNTTSQHSQQRQQQQSGTVDVAAAQSLLTTMLLTDDEDRITNVMASGAVRILIAQDDDGGGIESSQFSKILGGGRKQRGPEYYGGGINDDDDNALHVNSADQARIVVERLAVLSVCESDTIFRKYEGRTREPEKGGKKRLRKAARDADLDGFDFKGEVRSSTSKAHHDHTTTNNTTISGAASVSDVSVSGRSTSSNISNLTLKGPRKDTTSRNVTKAKQATVPALLASSKDSGAMRNRRTSLEQVGGSSRNRPSGSHRTSGTGAVGGDGPFDATTSPFGTSNYSKPQSGRSLQSDAASMSSIKTPPGSTGSRSQNLTRPQQQHQFDPFAATAFSYDTVTTASETTYGHEIADMNGNSTNRNGSQPSTTTSAKVLVNIALNEDLTCFYNLSKMSSCSVEGVIQVQVRSNVDQGVPFFLLMRDPSKHIQAIQENKKFADNMAESLANEPHASRPDYLFTVSVPKSDTYFPVMRYKCGNDLRPVPIVSMA